VLPANVRLGWEGIASYKHSSLFGLVVSDEGKKFYNIDPWWKSYKTFCLRHQSSGLCYKHVMILNDDSSIFRRWSIKLIDNPRVVNYDCHRFIIQDTNRLERLSLAALYICDKGSKVLSFRVMLRAFLNIIFGRKGIPGTNALAYLHSLSVMNRKGFIKLKTGANLMKQFFLLQWKG
jgi:hypothetical protein